MDLLLRVKNRGLKSDLRSAQRDIRAFGQNASGNLRSAFTTAIGGFASLGSIAGLASIGQGVVETGEKLTRIGIQAGSSAAEMDKLRATAVSTGVRFGLTTDKVVEAANAIIDLEGAAGFSTRKMEVLAKSSVATGAQLKDLAGTGYALTNAFKLKNADELEGSLSAVINAGKNGSVPLAEMGMVLQQIAVTFSRVSESGKAGAADLAAAIQVARKGFGSAAEVGTGIRAFISQLDSAAPKLRAFGVRVFNTGKDGKKQLKPMREILDQIANSRLVKDPTRMSQVFGSVEARQFLSLMIDNRAQFEKLAESARNANDVQADSQRFLNSSAGRLKVAIARARTELEGLFTPERIEKFVDLVENGLVPALDFVVEHTKEIGIAIAGWQIAKVTKATWEWAGAVGKLSQEYGGFGKLMKDSKGSVGSMLLSFGRFAGPIGLAAAAAWGLYKAIKSSREESEQLNEETLRQKELAGEALGPATKYDSQGRAAARREVAKNLRTQVEKSNTAIFKEDFADKLYGRIKEFEGSKMGIISKADARELLKLRDEFIKNRGSLPASQSDRLGELMRRAAFVKGEFLGGSRGVEAEQRATGMEAEAAAINAFEKLTFGRPDLDLRGLDLHALATEAGLSGDAIGEFERAFLGQMPGPDDRFVKRMRRGIDGRASEQIAIERDRLAVEDGKIVQRSEQLSPLSLSGMGAAMNVGMSELREFMSRPAGPDPQALAEALAASPLASALEAAMTNALRSLAINIDGAAVFSAVQNTQAGRRAPS